MILGADILYNEASWPLLLRTIRALSRPGTEMLLATVRRGKGDAEFFELAKDAGMAVEELTDSAEMEEIVRSESWVRRLGGAESHDLQLHRLTVLAAAITNDARL